MQPGTTALRLCAYVTMAITVATCCASATYGRDDLLNDVLEPSPFRLELRPYIVMPSNRNDIISMTQRPGDARLHITTQEGYIYVVNEDALGDASATEFFNVGAAVLAATGRNMSGMASQMGLQSVAFHPDFNNPSKPGYGKLYTTLLENRPTNTSGLNYLGNSVSGPTVNADGVLIEWTYNFATGQVPAASYRELFRVRMPVYDHPIKQARFNPHARPGDEDYGLLYVTHGDSNIKHSPNDDAQRLDNAQGKMIRINPLESGGNRYTIPATNPFASSSDPNVLREIFAYGFRNPHTYSFNQDDAGQVHIIVGDIGRNNVEEVNLVVGGANYGWPEREGTFVHRQLPDSDPGAGYITGVAPLAFDEASRGFRYPAAQYDHDSDFSEISSGNSIASGFVIRNGSDPQLHNQLIFSDFSRRTGGNMFHADFSQILSAITTLDSEDESRDHPSELTQAPVRLLQLALDHDRNLSTTPQLYDDFLGLLGAARTDVRFGEGAHGEMYISSKVNGTIYLVTNSVAPRGDFNADGAVTGDDFLAWQRDVGRQFTESPADYNRDDIVDGNDLAVWAANLGATYASANARSSHIPEPSTLALVAAIAIWGRAVLGAQRREAAGRSGGQLP